MKDYTAARAGLVTHLSSEIRDKRVLAAAGEIEDATGLAIAETG